MINRHLLNIVECVVHDLLLLSDTDLLPDLLLDLVAVLLLLLLALLLGLKQKS